MGKQRGAAVEKKLDGNGLITNWSMTWKEAKELKLLVINGLVDGMTAKMIKQNYSQFEKFATTPLNSALSNLRKQFNKETKNRSGYMESGGKYEGLKARMATIEESDEEEDDDFVVDDLADDVSALSLDSMNDGATVAYKSVAFMERRSSPKEATKKGWKGTGALSLPYIVDVWKDQFLQKRVSVEILLVSGTNSHKDIEYRVSTSKDELVITMEMNQFMRSPEGAFNSHLLNGDKVKKDSTLKKWLLAFLSIHPKSIARRDVISKTINRDSKQRKIIQEMRIPLPFKVRHDWVKEEEDDMFFGAKVVMYPDYSKHLHVEMMGVALDSYKPKIAEDDDDDETVSVKRTTPVPLPKEPGEIPSSVKAPSANEEKKEDAMEMSDDEDEDVQSVTPQAKVLRTDNGESGKQDVKSVASANKRERGNNSSLRRAASKDAAAKTKAKAAGDES